MRAIPIPRNDQLTQASERAIQEHYEKFKRESYEHLLKQRAAKERKEKEAGKPVESADQRKQERGA